MTIESINKPQRDSNIELLRVFAILSVVILHTNRKMWLEGNCTYQATQYLTLFGEAFSIAAVDIFFMITGYFSSLSDKRKIRKPISLLLQVFLFSLAFAFAHIINHKEAISLNLFINCLPHNYFITFYVVIFFISPYINRFLRTLSKSSFQRLLGILLLLFSVFPTIIDYCTPYLKLSTDGFDTISRYGSDHGYNVVNFSLMYIIGAYIRIYGLPEKLKRTKNIVLTLCTCVFILLAQLIVEYKYNVLDSGTILEYCNPIVILMAVELLYIFSRLNFKSRFVNSISKATFTCYLIHSPVLYTIGVSQYRLSTPPFLFYKSL